MGGGMIPNGDVTSTISNGLLLQLLLQRAKGRHFLPSNMLIYASGYSIMKTSFFQNFLYYPALPYTNLLFSQHKHHLCMSRFSFCDVSLKIFRSFASAWAYSCIWQLNLHFDSANMLHISLFIAGMKLEKTLNQSSPSQLRHWFIEAQTYFWHALKCAKMSLAPNESI